MRPIPGSLTSGPIDQKKLDEIKDTIRSLLKKGKALSSYFPKMRNIAGRMRISPTDTVADIGAGTGLFAMALLENNIPFGKLYCVDISGPSLEILKFMLGQSKNPDAKKVVAVHSTPSDVKLPPDSIDVAVLVNSPFYMARANKDGELMVDARARACVESLFKAMKPGALVHVFQMNHSSDPAAGISAAEEVRGIIQPFQEAGFGLVEKKDVVINLPHYHVVFEKEMR